MPVSPSQDVMPRQVAEQLKRKVQQAAHSASTAGRPDDGEEVRDSALAVHRGSAARGLLM